MPTRLHAAVLLCSVAMIAAARSPTAQAADYKFSSEPTIFEAPLRETAAVKIGANAAPWLPGMIAMLQERRAPALRPRIVALFTPESAQRYLAVLWQRRDHWFEQIEFHKVIESPDGRLHLRYLRSLRNWRIDLGFPSGMPIFADEPTVAVVQSSGGGSAIQNYELRLIQMKRNTVDITPDWAGRIVDVADIDGNGRYEVVAMDDRWTGFFNTAGSAGPFVPVVLDRVGRRFVPSCRKYLKPFRRWIETYIHDLADPSGMAPHHAEDYAGVMLAYAQIGALADARRAFADMMKVVEGRQHMPDWIDPQKTRQTFAAVLASAEKYAHAPCPVSAVNAAGGHFGAEAAIEHFRFAAPNK